MATKRINLTGVTEWCKPWPGQIDREYEDPDNGKGGNWNMVLVLDEPSIRLFSAIGAKTKLKDGNKLTLRRYERASALGDLGAPTVTGVDEGTPIGNGSTATVGIDVYDYEFKGRPGKALRWVSVHVDNLVVYQRPEDQARPAPAVAVPV
jgi:hypothetical protein